MPKIKAVLWDLDDTLLDVRKPENVAVKKCFEHFNLSPCTDEMVAYYTKINKEWWARLYSKELTKQEILVGRFKQFLGDFNRDTSFAERCNDYYLEVLGDVTDPKENAIETVKALENKVFQAIATNGIVKTQLNKIHTSGIDRYVKKAYISGEIGYEKPDIEFFDFVLKDLKEFKKNEIIIVGDSLTTDMQGGNNAGIVCCWYNPEHKKPDRNLKIDYEISDLAEVEGIVK